MKIGFVGAGKVGFTLGKYISEHKACGACVSGYYSRNPKSAMEASEFTCSKYYETLEDLILSSDALFLTVPDGAVADVWNSIRRIKIQGKSICHCSGALSSAVFSEIDRTGAFGYSIHPLFAVSDKLQSYQEISKAFFTIEGAPEHLRDWENLFRSLGNQVRVIQSENKVLYHSAAVFASNLVVGLYEESVRILLQCGFSRKEAMQAIEPLFLSNAKKVSTVGASDALTGPVERNDLETIKKHLDCLSETEKEIYLDLSKVLVSIAKDKHKEQSYEGMLHLLQEDWKDHEEHSSNI